MKKKKRTVFPTKHHLSMILLHTCSMEMMKNGRNAFGREEIVENLEGMVEER